MIFYYNSSSAALTNPSSGSPAHSVILIHQIHVAGGASRSATMVVVFAVYLCCVFWSRLAIMVAAATAMVTAAAATAAAAAAAAAVAMAEAEKATAAFCRGDDSDERRR